MVPVAFSGVCTSMFHFPSAYFASVIGHGPCGVFKSPTIFLPSARNSIFIGISAVPTDIVPSQLPTIVLCEFPAPFARLAVPNEVATNKIADNNAAAPTAANRPGLMSPSVVALRCITKLSLTLIRTVGPPASGSAPPAERVGNTPASPPRQSAAAPTQTSRRPSALHQTAASASDVSSQKLPADPARLPRARRASPAPAPCAQCPRAV